MRAWYINIIDLCMPLTYPELVRFIPVVAPSWGREGVE